MISMNERMNVVFFAWLPLSTRRRGKKFFPSPHSEPDTGQVGRHRDEGEEAQGGVEHQRDTANVLAEQEQVGRLPVPEKQHVLLRAATDTIRIKTRSASAVLQRRVKVV